MAGHAARDVPALADRYHTTTPELAELKPADDVVARRAAVLASGGEPAHSVVLRLDHAAIADADLAVREELEAAIAPGRVALGNSS